MAEIEKAKAVHDEKAVNPTHLTSDTDSDGEIGGFETDLTHLPPGYYRSPFFIGSMAAVAVSLAC
jgi:hypothetical protein